MDISQIKSALGKDFLERDNASAVHARMSGRLGWEKEAKGDGLSSFATSFDTQEEALKAAYRNACDMLSVMNIPFKVRIHIDPKGDSCTDSKNVWVSTAHFDEKDLSVGKKMDIFTGLAVHEGCHLLYTDFKAGQDPEGRDAKMLHALHNVIEDERIEHILGDDTPGLSNFIRETKYYFFDKFAREHRAEAAMQPRTVRLLNAVIQLVRYPNVLLEDDALLEEFGEVLVKVRECLDEWPGSTTEAYGTAKRIYDILVEDIKKNGTGEGEDEGKKKSGSGQSKDSEGKGDRGGKREDDAKSKKSEGRKGEKQEDSNDGPSGDESREESEEGAKEEKGDGDGKREDDAESKKSESHKGEEQEEDGNDGPSGDESREEGGEEEADPLTAEEAEKALSALAEMLSEMTSTPSGDDESAACEAVKGNPLMEKLCTGELERGKCGKTYIEAIRDGMIGPTEKRRYEESLARVRKYIPAVRKILEANSTEYRFSLKGMRSGRLDAGKLAEAIQGAQTVYTREGEVKSDRIAVCLLVDQSGSMSNSCCTAEDGRGLSRMDVARDTAVLLDEALSKLSNVDLFVYGHAADKKESGATEIYAYRDRKVKGRRTLGACTNMWNNADGFAIMETARLVRTQTQQKCLFFVISDGQPAAKVYRRINGIKHTKDAVEQISRQGFIPVQIAIDSCFEPSMMFKHYVKFMDLRRLAPELGKIVKKAVLEHSRRHVDVA